MDKELINRLKKVFTELKIKQTKVAEALGIEQPSVSAAIKKGSISKELAIYIGTNYNVDLNWLFLGDGDMIKTNNESPLLLEIDELERAQAKLYEKNLALKDRNKELETELESIKKLKKIG